MLRVSNFAQHNLLLNTILDSQRRVFEGQIQAATGKESQNYSGIAQNTTRLLDFESNLIQTDQYLKNNINVTNRLERMEGSLSGMFDEASRLRALLVQRLSDNTGTAGALAVEAQHILETIAGLLNTNEDGRFLFAGTATSVPPVTVPVPNPTTFGVPTNNYYVGNSTELAARVADSQTVTYGMAGDRLGFQQLISAVKGTIQGDNLDNTILLNTSLGPMDQAITALGDFRNEVGARLATIEKSTSRHQDLVLYLENEINEIENADVTEVMTRLTADQTALEASFMTVARLASLNLGQFLR